MPSTSELCRLRGRQFSRPQRETGLRMRTESTRLWNRFRSSPSSRDTLFPGGAKANMKLNDLQRREFIAGLAAMQLGAALEGADSNGMIYRKLGSTGERVSAIGLGGYHI